MINIMYYPIKALTTYKYFDRWKIHCTVFNLLAQYGFSLSLFLYLLISIDRLIAIRFPVFYRYRVTTKHIFVIIIIFYLIVLIKTVLEVSLGNDISSMEMMANQIPYQYRMQFTCTFIDYFRPSVRFGSLMYPFFIVGCLLICLYTQNLDQD